MNRKPATHPIRDENCKNSRLLQTDMKQSCNGSRLAHSLVDMCCEENTSVMPNLPECPDTRTLHWLKHARRNRFCSSAFALVAERKAFRGRLFICAMASGSVLDGLRFQRFVADEDATGAAASTTEGRYGVPRHNGDPSRLNEWIFRARTLERKEATVTDEQKKLGPLALRLIECFTGQALKIAQGLDMSKLEKADKPESYTKPVHRPAAGWLVSPWTWASTFSGAAHGTAPSST